VAAWVPKVPKVPKDENRGIEVRPAEEPANIAPDKWAGVKYGSWPKTEEIEFQEEPRQEPPKESQSEKVGEVRFDDHIGPESMSDLGTRRNGNRLW
jgi:hypothetical protein